MQDFIEGALQKGTKHEIRNKKTVEPRILLKFKVKKKSGVNASKLHLRQDACHSGGLRINIGHLGIFEVRRISTRALSLFAFTRKAATAAKIEFVL